MDGWYYRLLDSEFGPVSLENLIELVKSRSITRRDDVRFGGTGAWRQVGSIGTLMAHLPFEIEEAAVLSGGTADDLENVEFATADWEPVATPVRADEVRSSSTAMQSNSASNQWWCRSQDEQFGPVDFLKVIELVKTHVIARDDEVRFGDSGLWRKVGSIGPLMTHLPFENRETTVLSRGTRGGLERSDNPEPATNSSGKPTDADSMPADNQWWCRIQDEEFGPVDLQKVIELAKDHVISRDDEVRFGETGIWRRVGSIGPLMAHLPFESGKKAASSGGSRVAPIAQTAENSVAEASRRPNNSDANGSVAAESPPADDQWWCQIQGREYGPVELPKIIEWAAAGRLLPDDQVRFGHDPYVLANTLTGLFPEVPKPAITAAKPRTPASPSTPMAPPSIPSSPTTEPSETASSEPTPAPSPSSFHAPRGGMGAAGRPVMPFRPPKAKSAGGNDLVAKLMPIGMGIGGVALLVALLYFGIMLLPESTAADINRLKILQAAFGQWEQARKESSAEKLKPVREIIDKAGKSVGNELKALRSKNTNQAKLAFIARKMQELATQEVSEKTKDTESTINTSLSGLQTALKVN